MNDKFWLCVVIMSFWELSRDNGEAVVEGDSYDFAVMDTEKDTTEGTRKRKVWNYGIFMVATMSYMYLLSEIMHVPKNIFWDQFWTGSRIDAYLYVSYGSISV